MKNSKHTKIALLLLSLVLAVGTLFGITAMAEESGDGAVDVLAYNVVYGDRVQLAFAVDADVSEAASVEVVYYMEDPVANPEATAYKATLIDTAVKENVYTYEKEGVTYTCPVYITAGIPVKDIGDVVYAEAHTVGGTVEAPSYVSYSVAEYLYARLYKDGFANKTEADGDDFDRKELYEQFLLYAAKAQTVLVNNKLEDGAEPETLVTDLTYVSVVDGTLKGGVDGVIKLGDDGYLVDAPVFTGTAPAGQFFKYWNITTYEGGVANSRSAIADSKNLMIDTHTVFTPVFGKEASPEGFESFTASDEPLAIYVDKNVTSAALNGITGTVRTLDSKLTLREAGDNNYLELYSGGSSTGSGSYIYINEQSNVSGANMAVFEASLCFDNTVEGGAFIEATAHISFGGNAFFLMFRKSGNGVKLMDASWDSGDYVSNELGVTVAANEWHDFRLEYYYIGEREARTLIYMDGELVAISDNFGGKQDESKKAINPASVASNAVINIAKGNKYALKLDNIASYEDVGEYKNVISDSIRFNVDSDVHIPTEVLAKDSEAYLAANADGEYFVRYISKNLESGKSNPAVRFDTFNCNDANVGIIEYTLDYKRFVNGNTPNNMLIYGVNGLVCQFNFTLNSNGYMLIKNDGKYANEEGTLVGEESMNTNVKAADGPITLRFEYYNAEGAIKIYVNGNYLYTSKAVYGGTYEHSLLSYISIGAPRSSQADVFITDAVVYNAVKTYVAE